MADKLTEQLKSSLESTAFKGDKGEKGDPGTTLTITYDADTKTMTMKSAS